MFGYNYKRKLEEQLKNLRFERDTIMQEADVRNLPRRRDLHLEIRILNNLLDL